MCRKAHKEKRKKKEVEKMEENKKEVEKMEEKNEQTWVTIDPSKVMLVATSDEMIRSREMVARDGLFFQAGTASMKIPVPAIEFSQDNAAEFDLNMLLRLLKIAREGKYSHVRLHVKRNAPLKIEFRNANNVTTCLLAPIDQE